MFLYRCYDVDDVLLYVGITAKPDERFKAHARMTEWWPRVARRGLEDVPDDQARYLERRAIHDENPCFNKIGARPTFDISGDPLFTWGERLKVARAAAGLTQWELCRKVGCDQRMIIRWEAPADRRSYCRPGEETQVRLADIIGVTVTDLFPRTEREAVLEGIAAEYDELLERVGGGCS